jgi:apolipoprotein N-acyltransferase
VPEFPQTTKYLIFGARSFRGDPASPSVIAFNSAFLVNSQGRVLGHYHKQVLLAFGEYIPFLRFLGGVPGMPPVGQGFSAGNEPLILELPGSVRIGTLICYEDLMPFLARAFVRQKKANLLINLTNDAWFGKTVAPWQHARLAQWRAIENRRTLVRATNTGLTTIINAKGELLENLPLFSTGVLKAKAEILEAETSYVRFGDWFAWLALLASLLIWLYGWRAGSRLRF